MSARSYPTSDAPEKPDRDVVLNLTTVQKMLPLVRRITDDILANRRALTSLHPEEEQLDRQKRELTWPQRKRRYQIKEERAMVERAVHEAQMELRELGLTLLDDTIGRIGFPTLVNNRRAFFTWQPQQEALQNWQFADEDTQRTIPASWLKEIGMSV